MTPESWKLTRDKWREAWRSLQMPVAGDLQVCVHEFSRAVRTVDTSNGKVAIKLIAKGEKQRRVPRKHPPGP